MTDKEIKTLEYNCESFFKENCKLKRELRELNEKLDKAKEIIKEFLRISIASFEEVEPEFSELVDNAENFIKENKKNVI